MEHSKNVHVSIGFQQIGDAEVPVVQDANVPRRMHVSVADLGVLGERLGSLENSLHCRIGRVGIVSGDVLEDVLEPTARPLRSRLSSPRSNAPPHLFVRNGAPRIRIREAAFDHDVECQLSHDLVGRTIVGLALYEAG